MNLLRLSRPSHLAVLFLLALPAAPIPAQDQPGGQAPDDHGVAEDRPPAIGSTPAGRMVRVAAGDEKPGFRIAQAKNLTSATPAVRVVESQGTTDGRGFNLASPKTFSLDFPGGPLSAMSAKLNETDGSSVSIIPSPGLDPVLPAFSVRNVRVAAVLAALSRILEPQGYVLVPVDDNLAVLSRLEPRPSAFASLQVQRRLAQGWSIDDITAAIQMGTEFAHPEGRASTLRFKYHPGTKLLFVAGSAPEVDVARQVFDTLPDIASSKEPATASAKK
jgi:hypothetical protein